MRRSARAKHTSDAVNGFATSKIGNVDESVVERGIDVGNTEDFLALSDLGTERDGDFLLWGFLGLRRLVCKVSAFRWPEKLSLKTHHDRWTLVSE